MDLLLRMDRSKLIILTVLVFPVYALWLIALGNYALKKNDKPSINFNILGGAFTILCIYIWIYPLVIIVSEGIDVYLLWNKMMFDHLWVIILLQGMTCGYLALVLNNFERERGRHAEITSQMILKFILKFGALYVWVVGMWVVQEKYRKLIIDEERDVQVSINRGSPPIDN